jgi:hypothetical protein
MALVLCEKCNQPYVSQHPYVVCPDCRGSRAESPLPMDAYRYMQLPPHSRYREGYRAMFADERRENIRNFAGYRIKP